MTVGQLADHLVGLGQLLEVSGSKGAAAELTSLCERLAPFREQSVRTFAESLGRPAPETEESKKPTPRTTPKLDLEPLSREVQHMYESASSPHVTTEAIDALMQRLVPLTKDGLVIVAERIGLKGMGAKSKPAIQAAIRDRIEKRKGVITRASMTDRL